MFDEFSTSGSSTEPAVESERDEEKLSAGERAAYAQLRRLEEAVAEYHKLKKQYPPPPDLKAAFASANWIHSVIGTNIFDEYRGRCIAVADRTVRGTGEYDIEALVAGAKACQCHPSHLFACYIPRIDEF